MLASLILALAQEPALLAEGPGARGFWTLRVILLLPPGMQDPGIPVSLVSADALLPERIEMRTRGRGDVEFRVAPSRTASVPRARTWKLLFGATPAPGLRELKLQPGWRLETVIDLRGWAFPILDRSRAPHAHRLQILDSGSKLPLSEIEKPEYSFIKQRPTVILAWPAAMSSIPTLPKLAALAPVPAGCYWLRSESNYGACLPRLTPLKLPAGPSLLVPISGGASLLIRADGASIYTAAFLRRIADGLNGLPRGGRARTWGTEDVSARLRWHTDATGHYAVAHDLDDGRYEVLLTDPDGGWTVQSLEVEGTDQHLDLELERRCMDALIDLSGNLRVESTGWRVRLTSLDHGCSFEREWTPGRGRARFQGLPSGRWEAVLLTPDGSVSARAECEDRQGRPVRFALR